MSINHAFRALCLYLHIGRYHNLHKLTLHCVYNIALNDPKVQFYIIIFLIKCPLLCRSRTQNLSRYDIEDDLNTYGSAVYKAQQSTAESFFNGSDQSNSAKSSLLPKLPAPVRKCVYSCKLIYIYIWNGYIVECWEEKGKWSKELREVLQWI